jgi:hypothetical protein
LHDLQYDVSDLFCSQLIDRPKTIGSEYRPVSGETPPPTTDLGWSSLTILLTLRITISFARGHIVRLYFSAVPDAAIHVKFYLGAEYKMYVLMCIQWFIDFVVFVPAGLEEVETATPHSFCRGIRWLRCVAFLLRGRSPTQP